MGYEGGHLEFCPPNPQTYRASYSLLGGPRGVSTMAHLKTEALNLKPKP